MNAYQEVEGLLAEISAASRNPEIVRKTEEISIRCRAYMEPDQLGLSKTLGLTTSRAKIFDLLLARRGQAVSRQALMDISVHRTDCEADIKIVDIQICKLRQALVGTEYEGMIELVYGIGYRLRPAAAPECIAA